MWSKDKLVKRASELKEKTLLLRKKLAKRKKRFVKLTYEQKRKRRLKYKRKYEKWCWIGHHPYYTSVTKSVQLRPKGRACKKCYELTLSPPGSKLVRIRLGK